MKLKLALKETFGIEIEKHDKITLEHNYCNYSIVDVIVIDEQAKTKTVFHAYDTKRCVFPY